MTIKHKRLAIEHTNKKIYLIKSDIPDICRTGLDLTVLTKRVIINTCSLTLHESQSRKTYKLF